ncbi:MAG: hypothetical protein U9M89_01645 [Patescibacteria group bacterium]|nr:hypothetical protein [Patescibacteria group bacterium]
MNNTKQTQHTPGPWVSKTITDAETGQKDVIVGTLTSDPAYNFTEAICLEVFHTESQDTTQLPGEPYLEMATRLAESNARLMAAAPDLLEACEEALRMIRNCTENRQIETIEKIERAIEKVTKS